ncbi:MAG: PspC domain-containing protein [Caldilineaceae bacterium]
MPTKQRMLYRHPTNKMIGGVCGGLADFTGIGF